MLFSKYASFTGFNVETVEYKNISFTVWDVGGQDKVWSWDPSFSLILDYWKDFYAHKYHYILVPRLLLRPEVWFFWMRSPFFSLKKLPYNGLIMIFFFVFFCFTDPSLVEALLSEHTGSYICGGQQWQRPSCWGEGWIA